MHHRLMSKKLPALPAGISRPSAPHVRVGRFATRDGLAATSSLGRAAEAAGFDGYSSCSRTLPERTAGTKRVIR
jgi:hypothetical protein